MKKFNLAALLLLWAGALLAQHSIKGAPQLRKENGTTQLWVDNQPYLILGGELGNSSASSMAYMQPAWAKFKKMNLNTVVTPVYWELMEPTEGKFNFKLVDDMIAQARKNHIKLVLLWFGMWKNSMSCYVPGWVKTDEVRFPRATTRAGEPQEIVTPFSKDALAADKKAFAALLNHIKATDGRQHTVLMVQVENEIAMLPEARDHSALANEAFQAAVPAKFIAYLESHKNGLAPAIKKHWDDNGNKTSGNWETIFGKSLATDELFMAWYFAAYTNEVTKAGKAAYNIPMYVNAALNRPGKLPGEYPSAGPLPHVIDAWKSAAPDIDMLSPDFYNPDFKYWADLYTRADNPLFIPEHKFEAGVDAKAFYAIGHYRALGFSPFSIESTNKPGKEPLGFAYSIINQMAPAISEAKKRHAIDGVLLSKDTMTTKLQMGAYQLTVSHEYIMGWSPKAADKIWPLTGAIIIALSDNEFLVGGTGVVITFKPQTGNKRTGILQVDEGKFVNGKWQPERRMNGDEDHQGRHLRIPEGKYGLQRIKLYNY